MGRCRLAVCAALTMAAAALAVVPFPLAASAAAGGPRTHSPRQIQPTLMLNPAVIDYDHPTARFTGQVTDVGPAGPEGIGGLTVNINGPSGPYQAVTDTDGDFVVSAPAAKPGQMYQAEVDPTATTAGATSGPPITVIEMADVVHVTAKLGHATIKYGQTDTISGSVTYQGSAGSFVALPSTPVTITRISPAGEKPIQVISAKSGTFTASIPAQHAAGSWTASAGGTPLLDLGTSMKQMLNVQLPTDFKQVKINLSAFKALSVKACLNVTSPGGHTPVTASITLQYERTTKGPWKNLRTIKPTAGVAYCSSGSPVWQATLGAPVANAYYRVRFVGDSGLQAAVSPAAHRWRRLTKITSFSISPHTVAAKGAVTVKGRLWHDTGAWHPYGDHKVVVLFEYQGTWYFYEDEPRTNSRGYFSGRFTVYVTSPWIAQFDGDRTDFASASKRIDLTVTNAAFRSVPQGGPADPQRLR